MKPNQLFIVILTAFCVLAVTVIVAFANVAKSEYSVNQNFSGQNFTVSDSILSDAKLPALKIGGKQSDDVYLQSLDIQVNVTGGIAETRYTMIFRNKTNRILEGELTFPLPDGCSVTYYAIDINGKMRDAVPVEKAKATQVFEEIEQRQIDPGLLERVEGNNFRTRIYPIPAGGTRTVSIGYEEELPLEKSLLYYRLPMAYAAPLEKFAVKATVFKTSQKPFVPVSDGEIVFDKAGENYVATFSRENYQPAKALIFALPAPVDIPQVLMQSAQGSYYFLASVAPKTETRKKQWDNDLAIIYDVSLSGSQRDLKREFEALNIIFNDKKNATVHLYFVNNKFTKINDYQIVNGNWNALKKALEKAVFDGGTDFSKINFKNIAGNEILFFSDGLSTLSDADFLTGNNANRAMHCFVSSAKADYSAMKLTASKTRGKFVNINTLSAENLKSELLNETLQFLGAEHTNAVRELYPSVATAVRGNFSVAGIADNANAEITLLFGFGNKTEKRIKVKFEAKNAANQGNVYKIWAQKKITELDLNYEKNRAELAELGQQFGIVTRNTSLIVLETLSDYIRYRIAPPAELQTEYAAWSKGQAEQLRSTERDMLNNAVAAAENLKKWWDTDFTPKKQKYPAPDNQYTTADIVIEAVQSNDERIMASVSSNMAISTADVRGTDDLQAIEEVVVMQEVPSNYAQFPGAMRENKSTADKETALQPTIKIKSIKKDNDYLNKLTGKLADDYQTYLKLRTDYASSPAFYFDVSEWFYTHNDRETALKILTCIADLDLENASLYRLLGYRLKQYGEYALEKFVCAKIIAWRPFEPQSYRDYALALTDNRQHQAALDSMYSLLTKPYSANISNRSRGIEEIVVSEINNLIALNNLNTSKIDKRLIINIPIDIRVVINWNMNNTDIDLHVKDPRGEECYYRHTETQIGGRISNDNTSGYGPEQFVLKRAVKGKYQVYVNYFGDRQFTAEGPSTIMAEIFTKYADKTQKREVVCLNCPKTQSIKTEK